MALMIGFILGIEREYRAKPAGIKTYAMICLGATIFTHVSLKISPYADPSRVAAQIVSGLGFIGAGTIFQSKRMITGLTTAATLWVIGSLGILIGLGIYGEAFICLLLIYIYFTSTRVLQMKQLKRFKYTTSIECTHKADVTVIEQLIKKLKLTVITKSINKSGTVLIHLTYLCKEAVNDEFIKKLLDIENVKEISG